MSFRGVNFKWQEVRPEDDGRLYSAIFTDGIIYGCAFSSAGYTLTLGPGYLMACGRLIKVSAAQNFAVNAASEGFARLLLRINLNLETSETAFKQVEAAVEYSLSEDGFAAPFQADINDGVSSLYELPLAVVTLGGNGITSIKEKLSEAEFKEGDG